MNNPAYLYSEYKKRKIYFNIATFTAFLASALFIVGFFAGTIQFWTWTSEQWPYGILGFCITLAVTGFQHILYSSGDVKSGKNMTIFAFFLSFAFGMLTEVGGGMEREEARMLDKSVSSPVFQTLMQNIGNITNGIGSNPYAQQIADAEALKARHVLELNRCDRHAKLGPKRVERCEVYEQKKIDEQASKIAAFKQMAQSADTERQNTLTASMGQAKSFERDEQNHHPLVKLLKEWFTVESIVASFLLSAIIIGVFEFAFHYQGKSFSSIRDQLLVLGYDLTNGKGAVPQHYDAPKESVTQKADELHDLQTEKAFAAATEKAKQDHPTAAPKPLTVTPAASVAPVVAQGYPTPITATADNYKPAQVIPDQPSVGHTELLSNVGPSDADSKRSIGFTAPLVEQPAAAPTNTDPAIEMSAPEAKALLKTINNAKFDAVFVGIATGSTPVAIGKARKIHNTGVDMVQSTLVCLEYCGLVSAKNENGQRTVTETISAEEAEVVMGEIKNIIRGAAA